MSVTRLKLPTPTAEAAVARDRALVSYGLVEPQAEDVFDELIGLVARQLGTNHAQLSVVASDRVWLKASVAHQGLSIPLEDSFCAYVAAEGRSIVLPDTTKDPRFCRHPAVTSEYGVRFYAGAPMIAPDGTVIGVLCAWDTEPKQFSDDDVRSLEVAARYVMALLNERLVGAERERETAVLAATGRVLSMIVGGESLVDVLDVIARSIEDGGEGLMASIHLLDGDTLRLASAPHLPAAYRSAVELLTIGPAVGSCGTAAHSGETVVVSDIQLDPRWLHFRDAATEHGLRSCWSIPVIGRTGEVLGTFALYSREVRVPTEEDRLRMRSWVDLTELAITRVRGLDALHQAATRDALTGLMNRAEALTQLEELLTARRDVALLFVDLDQFKFVNDSFGHQVGDEFLRAAAARVMEIFRLNDAVARFGGDEFLVICPDVTARSATDALAHRIVAALNASMVVAGHTLSLSASVGVARTDGRAIVTPDQLIDEADLAMYAAKRSGRNCVAVFTEQIRREAAQRLALESELNLAVLAGELECFYQPTIDLRDGQVAGVEALLRWHSPTRGTVLPSEFIPIAEESGLIEEIGEFALRRACSQLVRWRSRGGPWSSLRVWVNVSVRQLDSERFGPTVLRLLQTSGLSGRQLGLEVTESSFMTDLPHIRATLQTLRDAGVRIAIDDFGTGYSSLALLRDLPVDMLKIDRQFLAPDASDGILEVILGLARTLDLAVVGEGVESSSQRERLRALGCTYGQGYLWTEPMPASDIGRWVERHAAADIGNRSTA